MVWCGLGMLLLPMLPNLAVAERWTLENRLYLPAVGLCVIVATVLESGGRKGQWEMGVAYGFLGMCALMSWRYQESFRNRETFTRAAVLGSPNSAMAHLIRGGAYQEVDRDFDAAEREYRRAIELDPDERIAHNDLGVLLMNRKRWTEAEAELREEIVRNQEYGVAYYNLGIVLRELGRTDEAATQWQRALERDPKHINSMGELLVYYGKRGDRQMAAHYVALLAGQGVRVSISPSGDVSAAQ
jgi:Tfp pilus assembly protein PilF